MKTRTEWNKAALRLYKRRPDSAYGLIDPTFPIFWSAISPYERCAPFILKAIKKSAKALMKEQKRKR